MLKRRRANGVVSQDGFTQPLRAAQAIGLQSTRVLQQFADVWVDALLVLLPTAVPRQTVRDVRPFVGWPVISPCVRPQVAQLVYVGVGCVALYMLKVLLSVRALAQRGGPATAHLRAHCSQTLLVVASATLGIVCLSRWLVYNGTVDGRRDDDRCFSVCALFSQF